MNVHSYTSFSFSYLNRARVLAASIKKYHPEWKVWAFITDEIPDGFDLNIENEDFDFIVYSEDLMGEKFSPWIFKHDIVEACTAVKGDALLHIMKQDEVDQIFYFDPDISLFNRMDNFVELLKEDDKSIILTPHQLVPEKEELAIIDNEICSLDYGVFNLGFFATDMSTEAIKFANWWTDRLNKWCYDRLDLGVFVDQKWCNLIPCFFKNVYISRDSGCNVASWNLSNRVISTNGDGELVVNESDTLKFYHFTKLGEVGDFMTRRYAKDNTEVYEIWGWYKEQVNKYTDLGIPQRYWCYARYKDGSEISKVHREFYRERKDLQAAFEAPFESGSGTYQDWLGAHSHEIDTFKK